VTALVAGDPGLLVEHGQLQVRPPAQQLAG